MELRLPLEMSPGREAACRAVFGTWGFFRTMHGKSRLLFPPPGDLPDPGIEPESPALAGGFFTTALPGKPSQRPHSGISHI